MSERNNFRRLEQVQGPEAELRSVMAYIRDVAGPEAAAGKGNALDGQAAWDAFVDGRSE